MSGDTMLAEVRNGEAWLRASDVLPALEIGLAAAQQYEALLKAASEALAQLEDAENCRQVRTARKILEAALEPPAEGPPHV